LRLICRPFHVKTNELACGLKRGGTSKVLSSEFKSHYLYLQVVSADDLNDIQLKIVPDPFCKGGEQVRLQNGQKSVQQHLKKQSS